MRGRKPVYSDPLKTSITCEKFKYMLCGKLEYGPTAIFDAGMNWVIDMAIENEDHRLTKDDIVTYRNLMNKRLNRAIREKVEAELFTTERLARMEETKEPDDDKVAEEAEKTVQRMKGFDENVSLLHRLLDPIFSTDECRILDDGLSRMPEDMTEVGYYKGIIQTGASKLECMRDLFKMDPPSSKEEMLALQDLPELEHIFWRWLQDRVMA